MIHSQQEQFIFVSQYDDKLLDAMTIKITADMCGVPTGYQALCYTSSIYDLVCSSLQMNEANIIITAHFID